MDHGGLLLWVRTWGSRKKGALLKFSDLIRDATSMSTQYPLGTKYEWICHGAYLCMATVAMRTHTARSDYSQLTILHHPHRHSTNTKLCRGSNSWFLTPCIGQSSTEDLSIGLQSLQAELAMERKAKSARIGCKCRFCCRMSSAMMPALAHSSSCSAVGAPLTPQPP